MDNGVLLQLLIVIAISVFGIWSTVQKTAKGKSASPDQSPNGENFPFPSSASVPVPESRNEPDEQGMMVEAEVVEPARSQTLDSVESLAVEPLPIDRPPEREPAVSFLDSYVGREEEWLTIPEQGPEEAPPDVVERQAERPKVVTDLRTIIISSELLKPKYQEY